MVRFQAARGSPVTNRRHERVTLDSFERHLVQLLDGEHGRNALAESLTGLASAGTLTVKVEGQPVHDSAELRKIMASQLESKLHQFGRLALLVG